MKPAMTTRKQKWWSPLVFPHLPISTCSPHVLTRASTSLAKGLDAERRTSGMVECCIVVALLRSAGVVLVDGSTSRVCGCSSIQATTALLAVRCYGEGRRKKATKFLRGRGH
jgi:hypothetical protein